MRRPRFRRTRTEGGRSFVRLLLLIAVLAWLFRSLVFAPFTIPSGSMLPTLYIGDYLLVAKWPYGFSRHSFPFQVPPISGRMFSELPEQGDVVVFASSDGKEDLIKRVIGLPGDTIEVRGGRLSLNGRPVGRGDAREVSLPVSPNSPCRRITPRGIAMAATDGDKCVYRSYRETLPSGASYRVIDQVNNAMSDEFGPVTVPPGQLFLMGDNRDDSLDSRFSAAEGGIGLVPLDHVIGKAVMVGWSTDGSAAYLKPWTWFRALRTERVGKRIATAR